MNAADSIASGTQDMNVCYIDQTVVQKHHADTAGREIEEIKD